MPEPNNLDRWAREVVEQSKGSVWSGLGLTLVFHIVALVAIFFILSMIVTGERGLELIFFSLVYFGLSQLVYMIPAILISRRRGETETAKGLIIGASITFLLSATCSGLFFLNR
ncbi:MAG TPA: hypothetical protein VK747_16485 [Blastocatellia bacterium]|nr:hypothetical protein [Blastocatellia bacterium]